MYCESAAAQYNSSSEQHMTASINVMDFWARVTPGILQLLSHSKVVGKFLKPFIIQLVKNCYDKKRFFRVEFGY